MKPTTVLFALSGFAALVSGHGLADPFSMLTDHDMKETLDQEDEVDMVALVEELADELRDFDVEDVSQEQVKCPSYLCSYNWSTKSFVYSCLNLSFRVQKKKNLNHDQRTSWMVNCFKCQSGCATGPALIIPS